MKQILAFLIFSCVFTPAFTQQQEDYICRLGFAFEMSQQGSWGLNKPVILSVRALSPADAAGLKINDVIETINDAPTENQMISVLNDWMQSSNSEDLKLTVSNLQYKNKEVILHRDCKLAKAINEKDLALAHSFYSLEDMQTRSFTCPFKTSVNSKSNLMSYKTFGFSPVDEKNKELENLINEEIKTVLENKGLQYKQDNPDLVVHTYYSFNKNLNYEGSDNPEKFPVACRYNMHKGTMEDLPIYYHPLINQRQAQFLLSFGIRLLDKKHSSASNEIVVWECEANEMLSSEYKLDSYTKFHIPLMFMQYPFPQTSDYAQYRLTKIKYNYTGLNYNIDNLKEVIDVDRFSPAYQATLQPGDEIEKINGMSINSNPKTTSSAYKQFIFKTMSMRDPKTVYTDASGFTQCMLWDKFQYAQIADAFRKPEYSAIYSYLFYFEPFINLSGTNNVSFEIKRNKQKQQITVTPTVKLELSFENYK